eukprot:gene11193-3250_t
MAFSTKAARILTERLLCYLPVTKFAFAYGSAAFPQHNHIYNSRTMLDIIIAVEDAEAFHSQNIRVNPYHYSYAARMIGPKNIAAIQQSTGARIYYHPYVYLGDQLVKYGVISLEDIKTDLLTWETLYVSGRLHKPVAMLTSIPKHLQEPLKQNLRFAVFTASCLLPDRFNEVFMCSFESYLHRIPSLTSLIVQFDLYCALASLSYTGDIRMGLAERRGKAVNIVHGNFEKFRNLYTKTMENCFGSDMVNILTHGEEVPNPIFSKTAENVLQQLPIHLRERLNPSQPLQSQMHGALRHIISRSSLAQSIKGIFSAGPIRSLEYLKQKLKKAWTM